MNGASAQQSPATVPKDYAVAGIGASAGGLAALQAFFERVPSNTGIAYVVVVHLSPEYESHIAELLQSVTTLPVRQVTRPVRVAADHVYVISPRSHLRMTGGVLEPEAAPRPRGRTMTIDVFFETLADAHEQAAIGIVLSGSGSDGTHGIRALRAKGGITFAQEPLQAEYDAMPR